MRRCGHVSTQNNPVMLQNYFKIAFRSLWRNGLYSLINIGGLSVGLAVSLLILLYVLHEKTYDRFHKNADGLFRVYAKMNYGGQAIQMDHMSARFGPAVREANPNVLDVVRISSPRSRVVIKTGPNRKYFEPNFILADPSFLTVFSFPLVTGNPATALTRPMTVLLTEHTAERYFGRDNPIGKTITLNNKLLFEVTGVLKNPPSNSTIQFDFVASLKSDPAVERLHDGVITDDQISLNSQQVSAGSYLTYFLLKSLQDTARISRTIPALVKASGVTDDNTTYIVDPLTSVHLGMNFGGVDNSRYLTIFMGIAGLILLLALINYMSLTTARATKRALEVGVRKVMGANRRELAGQFYGESVLITLLSFGLALVLMTLLRPFFYNLLQLTIDSEFVFSPTFMGMALALLVICVLASGSYPALLLSSFSPVAVLKGNQAVGRGTQVRRGFTVFQFAVSIGLIICSVLIYRQAQHLQNRNLGLHKDRVLVVPMDASLANQYRAFRQELRQLPGVERVAAASSGLYKDGTSIFFAKSPKTKKDINLHFLSIDDQFAETLRIPWKIKPDPARLTQKGTMVINETAARQLAIADKPLGQQVKLGSNDHEIVGVMRNFFFTQINNSNEALALMVSSDTARAMAETGGSLYIRILPGADLPQLVSRVGETCRQMGAESPFEYYFLDDSFNALYKSETRLSTIFGVFTGFALLIACLGLFGLAAFIAESRTKEIGVRKVLGASISSIVTLLSKDFLKLVLMAIMIASPIAWYVMDRWLQDFAYRIDIEWWVFVVAGLLAIGIALLTVSFQSIRAALMNPVRSLRSE